MDEIFEHQGENQEMRPQGLSTICILSFIGSGLSLLSNAFAFVFYDAFTSYLTSDEINKVVMAIDPKILLDFINTAGRFYFLITTIFYFASVIGVYYMWHLYKKGIHFYAIAQISLLILPLIFIDSSLSVLPGLVLSGAFIYFYSRFLNIMR